MPRRHQSFARQHDALIGLIALNVIAFIVQHIAPEESIDTFLCTPAAVTSAWDRLLQGSLSAGAAQTFGTLVTYAFLHADFQHIAFNMLYLWVFAYLVGELIGQWRVVAIYIITAVGGAVCYTLFKGESQVPMLGASGAVTGFEGAYLGLAVRYTIPDPHVWPMARPVSPVALCALALIRVGLDLTGTVNPAGSNTAFTAHLGGFVTGLALTSFFSPTPRGCRVR